MNAPKRRGLTRTALESALELALRENTALRAAPIKCLAQAGEDVSDCFYRGLLASHALAAPVLCEHNDVKILATPDRTVPDMLAERATQMRKS